MKHAHDVALVRRAVAVATRLGGGGLAGLRDAFVRVGEAATFDSWVAHGPNLPISPVAVASALEGSLAALARATRREPALLAQLLAGVLPSVVDELTPDGVLPAPPVGWFGRWRALLRAVA